VHELLGAAAPGFDNPLALLRACHDRILKQCATLRRLIPHLATYGADAAAREAAARVLRYFTTAGRHHHEDEEIDLFPLLARDAALAPLLANLKAEHAVLDARWAALEPLLATLPDSALFATQALPLCEAYEAHVEKENKTLLPAAQQLLTSDELRRIGKAMAARRGLATG
jgi:hemerythrin-like domain-containing protein